MTAEIICVEVLRLVCAGQRGHGLAGDLSQALAGDEGLQLELFRHLIGNAQHAAAHQNREQHVGRVVTDILLRLRVAPRTSRKSISAWEMTSCCDC